MKKFYLVPPIFLAFIILNYGATERDMKLRRSEEAVIILGNMTDSIPKKITKDPVDEDIKRLMPPVPASFSSSDSARLIANWRLGIKFYKANCAKCHGIFGTGRDSIPNFSREQIDDYKTGLLAADKENHAAMSNMTMDELDAVFLFLTNIKRGN